MLSSNMPKTTEATNALPPIKLNRWVKPTIKTITYEDLKTYIISNACSDFTEICPLLFR